MAAAPRLRRFGTRRSVTLSGMRSTSTRSSTPPSPATRHPGSTHGPTGCRPVPRRTVESASLRPPRSAREARGRRLPRHGWRWRSRGSRWASDRAAALLSHLGSEVRGLGRSRRRRLGARGDRGHGQGPRPRGARRAAVRARSGRHRRVRRRAMGMDRFTRPGFPALAADDVGDRRVERQQLFEPGVRPAVRGTATRGHGRRAPVDRRADAGPRVRRRAIPRPVLRRRAARPSYRPFRGLDHPAARRGREPVHERRPGVPRPRAGSATSATPSPSIASPGPGSTAVASPSPSQAAGSPMRYSPGTVTLGLAGTLAAIGGLIVMMVGYRMRGRRGS